MSRPPVLPKKDKLYEERMTLVLDLDETLVHCSVDPMENSELTFPVVHCGQELLYFVHTYPLSDCLDRYQVHVRRRPYFKEFCEKVIFCVSAVVYLDIVVRFLNGLK